MPERPPPLGRDDIAPWLSVIGFAALGWVVVAVVVLVGATVVRLAAWVRSR